MVTLRQVLDQTLELLEYEGQFKSFGDLSKHKYQMSKPDEDKEIRRIMYEGGLGNSEEALKQASETRKKRHKEGKYKESEKKALKNIFYVDHSLTDLLFCANHELQMQKVFPFCVKISDGGNV